MNMATNPTRQTGQICVHKLMAVLSAVLSDKYGLKITMTARPKDETEAPAA